MGLNKGHWCVYASLNIPSSLKIWSRRCVPLQMLLLKVSKNKWCSSSSRRRWTKRKQQGAEQPSSHRKAAAKNWSYPAGHHPQQTIINWRRKGTVSWELSLRRDSSDANRWNHQKENFRETTAGHSEGKRNSKRTVSNDSHLEEVSKVQGHLVKQWAVRTTDQRVTV